MDPYTSSQETNCARTSINGFLHRIRQLTITSRAIPITRKQQPGSFKGAFSANGNPQAHFFGSTGSVSPVPLLTRYPLIIFLNCSWLRQEYSLVSGCFAQFIIRDQCLLSVPRSSKILKPCAKSERHLWLIFISTFATSTSKACAT